MEHVARWLRRLADRLDYAGAPKRLSILTFTFEKDRGAVVRQDGRGTPLWVLGDDALALAHSESDSEIKETSDREDMVDWLSKQGQAGQRAIDLIYGDQSRR